MYCFTTETFPSRNADDKEEVRMVSIENQSTLMYTVILHVVFIKLFYELDRVTEISILFVVVTILIYYGLMLIASKESVAMHIDERLLDITQQTFTNFVPVVIIYLGSFVSVTIDYTIKKMVRMRQALKGDEGTEIYTNYIDSLQSREVDHVRRAASK